MSPIDRRAFLSLAAAGATGLLDGSGEAWAGMNARRARAERILVLGAGIAGLTAARELTRQGLKVTVLEARNEAGGRIRTDRTLGAPVELGPTWLHGGPGNPLKDLTTRIGIEKRVYDATSFSVFDSGTGRVVNPFRQYDWVPRELSRTFEFAVLWETVFKRHPTVEDAMLRAKRLLKHVPGAQRELTFDLLKSYLEAYLAEPLSEASLVELRSESKTRPEGDLVPVGEEFVFGGLDRLTAALSEGLEIKTGVTIRRVLYSPGSVRAEGDHESFEADSCVVTLPLGVLKRADLEFTPALPQRQREAISRLSMGTLNKVIVEFPHGRWMPDTEFLAVEPDGASPCGFYTNLNAYTGNPTLIGISGGARALALEELSDDELGDQVHRELRRAWGNSVPTPQAVRVTRWSRDPYARGSYSGLKLPGTVSYRRALARPVLQTLFFAGEATDPTDYGTLHGAYWSGLRAAGEVARIAVGEGSPGTVRSAKYRVRSTESQF